MRNILVQIVMEENDHGLDYTGILNIGGKVFKYHVTCSTPYEELGLMPASPKAMREAFPIRVWNHDNEIELSDLEYGFFFQTLVALVLPELHDSDEKEFRHAGELQMQQQWITVLSSAKFGCTFP